MPDSTNNTSTDPQKDGANSDEDTPETEPEHSDEVTGGESDKSSEQESPISGPLSTLTAKEKDHLMDQYIHYGEVAIETSNQRVQMNRFFGVILTSILAGLFALARGNLTTTTAAIVLFASTFGSLICYFWYQSLQSYRRLNKARYAILNEVESVLPVRMYLDEWRYLKREKPDPEIIDPRPADDPDHRSHTIVKQWFVRLLAAGYVSVGGYAGGFIFTPTAAKYLSTLPGPTTVGFLVGGSLLSVLLIVFWIQTR